MIQLNNNDYYYIVISDLGFSQAANIDSNLSRESQIWLQNYLNINHIHIFYSIGMIMWQMTSGHRPFHDQEHGIKLILDILDGKRPEITGRRQNVGLI
ncbi:hypothetical protein Glove_346g161 [Diversispora epigaea]|uniref:Protein kinase domain-containing protein n=1 Tax=Diversispora epigaea TaxID=1348612 RepID=A0A397HKA6_9GLOM|nr:hypothetical protein Glove_346g161 [Diversispora epigaea]